MTHKKVIRRQIEGTIDSDKDIPRMRMYFQKFLEDSMRDEGIVPLLDISPAFSLEYVDKHWNFLLTIHGVRVGEEEAQKWQGCSDGKMFPRHTPQGS